MILLLILLNIFEIEKVYDSPWDFNNKKNFFNRLFFGKENNISFNLPQSIIVEKELIFICDGSLIYKIEKGKIEELKKENLSCKDMEFFEDKLFVSFSGEKDLYFYDMEKKIWDLIPFHFLNIGGLYYYKKNKTLYITDTSAHKIYKFRDKIEEFIKEGLNFPIDLVISGDGKVFISDSFDYEIEVRDLDGKFISSFGSAGDDFGYFKSLRGIAIDEEDRIYTGDTTKGWIQVFSKDGQLLYVYKDENFYHPFYLNYLDDYLWVPDGILKIIVKLKVNPPK